MHGISAGVAACMVVAVTVGCGSARASHPGSAADAAAPAKMANPGKTGVATAGRVGAGARSGCRGAAAAGPVGKTFVVTLAGNQKTYCVRVGDTLRVYLRGAGPGRWLRPL